MIRLKVIVQGKSREEWLFAALSEYEKRLRGRIFFEWVYADTPQALAKLALQEKILVALDVSGDPLDSPAFHARFIKLGSRASFVIGGPEGLSEEILNHAAWRWSLSPLTFTNQMVRLVLVEQIYRAAEIDRGSPYHK